MADLKNMLRRFGTVTVMEPTFYELGTENALCTLDTLRISNFTQEGPTKTAKGGLFAKPVLKYGKTARLEMEDAIGRIEVLEHLFGAIVTDGTAVDRTETATFEALEGQKVFTVAHLIKGTPVVTVNGVAKVLTTDFTVAQNAVSLIVATVAGDKVVINYTYADAVANKLQITDKFAKPVKIVGKTFVIDEATGNKQWVKITIFEFYPDSTLNQTMEAEGDFGVFNIAGDLYPDENGVFYEYEEDPDHTATNL